MNQDGKLNDEEIREINRSISLQNEYLIESYQCFFHNFLFLFNGIIVCLHIQLLEKVLQFEITATHLYIQLLHIIALFEPTARGHKTEKGKRSACMHNNHQD